MLGLVLGLQVKVLVKYGVQINDSLNTESLVLEGAARSYTWTLAALFTYPEQQLVYLILIDRGLVFLRVLSLILNAWRDGAVSKRCTSRRTQLRNVQ